MMPGRTVVRSFELPIFARRIEAQPLLGVGAPSNFEFLGERAGVQERSLGLRRVGPVTAGSACLRGLAALLTRDARLRVRSIVWPSIPEASALPLLDADEYSPRSSIRSPLAQSDFSIAECLVFLDGLKDKYGLSW
jgi:hypothetical protein